MASKKRSARRAVFCNQKGRLCPLMTEVLDRVNPNTRVGIQSAPMFNLSTGKSEGTKIVHHTQGSGRGKERKASFYAVLNFCPFCGGALNSTGSELRTLEREQVNKVSDA